MDEPTTERALRAARRRETWSLSVHTLADAPPSQRTSPEVGLASSRRLSCEAWAMSGRPWPDDSLGRSDVVANKRATGRAKDLIELELLAERGAAPGAAD